MLLLLLYTQTVSSAPNVRHHSDRSKSSAGNAPPPQTGCFIFWKSECWRGRHGQFNRLPIVNQSINLSRSTLDYCSRLQFSHPGLPRVTLLLLLPLLLFLNMFGNRIVRLDAYFLLSHWKQLHVVIRVWSPHYARTHTIRTSDWAQQYFCLILVC